MSLKTDEFEIPSSSAMTRHSPESSDGVVGYWSTHLEGARSELIVPTGHDM
jgi:hypothetical protein